MLVLLIMMRVICRDGMGFVGEGREGCNRNCFPIGSCVLNLKKQTLHHVQLLLRKTILKGNEIEAELEIWFRSCRP